MTEGGSNTPSAPEGFDQAPYWLRPWAGKTYRGVIDIGAQHLIEGWGGWVFGHEAVHDLLVKTTPYGQVQLVLELIAARAETPAVIERLLSVLRAQSLAVQEGAACFVGSLSPRPPIDLPPAYERALEAFSWIPTSFAVMPEWFWSQLALLCARRALQTDIAQRWVEDHLWEPERLERYLNCDEANPSHRLECIMLHCRSAPLHVVASGVADEAVFAQEIGWRCGLPDAMPLVPAATPHGFAAVAHDLVMHAPPRVFVDNSWLARGEIGRSIGATSRSFGPAHRSVRITSASASRRPVHQTVDIDVLERAELLVIHANPLGPAFAPYQFLSGRDITVLAGEAIVTSYFSDAETVGVMTLNELGPLIARLRADATVCTLSDGYAYEKGDLITAADDGILRGRRHVVLVQAPLWALLPELGASTIAGEPLTIAHLRYAADSELAFFLLMPTTECTPLVVLPVIAASADDILREMVAVGIDARSHAGHANMEMLKDYIRVARWLTDGTPGIVDLFQPEQRPLVRGRPSWQGRPRW